MALGSGVIEPALYAGIKEYTDERTAAIGYSLLYAIMNLGIVAESFVSPFIRTNDAFRDLKIKKIIGLGWGIDGVFWMCAAFTGFVLLVHLGLFTKKVEDRDRLPSKPRVQRPGLRKSPCSTASGNSRILNFDSCFLFLSSCLSARFLPISG